ncbi:DUF2269 family protein [Pseudomonas amygdali]|uniref:DUF2269 domain-containing protein n=1 Tax=Pseudomonas amygdali pv. lachrymans str. M301315 TaxID=629260 RepID=A0AAD0PWC4_PSEAV|nr:DUF2269 domain-containing protein [Pseudomonas amygdali]AXH59952.1 DUF2269 domain-containing protein [Pseudomonas amygdali pv. lachrymans str. M301315]RMT05657.1 hypothetical protein ALP54_03815 [Pseudomonas amygdali pv. lachrymans]
MNAYLLVKTLHILSSTILFGLGAGSAYYALRAWRSGQVAVISTTFKHLVFADWAFTTTTAILQPVSGLALMHLAGWSLKMPWIQWSIGLYVFAGICWLPVVWLQIRVHKIATQALKSSGEMPMKAHHYMRWWIALGWPAFISFIIIFYLMVAKPM